MLIDTIKNRRSMRTFSDGELNKEDLDKVKAFLEKADNPYGIQIDWHFLSVKEDRLSIPIINGADTYIAGSLKKGKHALEAFGFSFEKIILYCTSIGIGTTCIAGTMDRKGFERAVSLKEGEIMPCVSPLGYPAKMSLKETLMRKAIRADQRLSFEELFFQNAEKVPYERKDETMNELLEMVRLSPSAVNKQPWRLIVQDDKVLFYKAGEKKRDDVFDIQKVDLGMAMCHFALGLEEKGIAYDLVFEDADAYDVPGWEFIASFMIRRGS